MTPALDGERGVFFSPVWNHTSDPFLKAFAVPCKDSNRSIVYGFDPSKYGAKGRSAEAERRRGGQGRGAGGGTEGRLATGKGAATRERGHTPTAAGS